MSAQARAAALDAADGVMDGKCFGRQILTAPTAGYAPQYATAGYAPQYATAGFAPQYATAGFAPQYATAGFAPQYATAGFAPQGGVFPAGSQAAALDAADGVIDGKFNGRPIVQAGGAYPATSFGAYPTMGATPVVSAGYPAVSTVGAVGAYPTMGATPVVSAGYPGVSTLGAYPTVGAAYPTVGGAGLLQAGNPASTAAALDAADGVIDGKCFGRPIVQAGRAF
eukprot:NODE_1432_length_862_cov_94.844898_g1325_i1.p1 GENE.NODE_1432_length_862_cov_94.844898_g1325_i1~~NODE_1432_length_862_cov_94.844898_g1325_i1.p1  ORF type:complete len:254 (+),score=124.68 NODE_1432_length_862_cov_94.844898_g1325_i1:90-764(+)